MTESDYKPDLELLDRYQRFSSELIKIGLSGVGILAFFVKDGVEPLRLPTEIAKFVLLLLSLSAVAFMITAAFALAHRYHSTDGIFYHMRAHRRKAADREVDAEADKLTRNRIYERSGRVLGVSVIFCCLATLLLVVAIFSGAAYFGDGSKKTANPEGFNKAYDLPPPRQMMV